jgi:RNA polymerase sigma-70 factor, ECF subfamily
VDAAGDRQLWERTAADDAEAFAALFERHADAVYTFCFRRTASWAEAEDAMADVFLAAWRRHATSSCARTARQSCRGSTALR